MSDRIRILIADDHLVVREGLLQILETAPDMLPIGEACDGAEAVAMASELQPDVILMDLRMPRMDGLEAITQIQNKQPEIAIVILTTYNEEDLMLRGLKAGARGFLLKDTDRDTLFRSIRSAARGETLLSPGVASQVFSQAKSVKGLRENTEVGPLTDRELEVLRFVAQGARNKEVAAHLGITERTIKAHLTSVYNKFGVDSRAAAVTIAITQGLLSDKALTDEDSLL